MMAIAIVEYTKQKIQNVCARNLESKIRANAIADCIIRSDK
jgi:hypothetical protein